LPPCFLRKKEQKTFSQQVPLVPFRKGHLAHLAWPFFSKLGDLLVAISAKALAFYQGFWAAAPFSQGVLPEILLLFWAQGFVSCCLKWYLKKKHFSPLMIGHPCQ